MTSLRNSLSPLRMPVMAPGIRFPSRPPLRFSAPPVIGAVGFSAYSPFFGYNPFLGYTPFWLRPCSGLGIAYGCGMLPIYSGIGYIPSVYPSFQMAYPAQPPYPSDPAYSPSESSATLPYASASNPYSSVGVLPGEELTSPGSATAPLRSETLLYLKDGSVFAVASYTVAEGVLHYTTSYGEKNDLPVDLLDLQKTIESNATRGVAFTLTPPDPSVRRDSQPTPLGPAPAPEGPITPPRP